MDGGVPTEHLNGALKVDYVADRIVKAADYGEKNVWMPAHYQLGHLLYWLFPSFVERRASAKYNFLK